MLFAKRESSAQKSQRYEEKKAREGQRQRTITRDARDIATEFPECRDPKLRKRCEASLQLFCEVVFPHRFSLPWSDAHLHALKLIQETVIEGGQFAYAMARGSGKTTIVEVAVLWAKVRGSKRFTVPIGASTEHAIEMLESIKSELETNEKLLELFPEAVYPFRCLEGIANRCKGQLHDGKPTHIQWKKRSVTFATIPDAACSGATIRVAGLQGRIRGMKHTHDGRVIRPDMVILDDPQTRQSAESEYQVRKRLATINGDVMGLAGPGKKIAAFMPCTVVQRGDLADQILDRKLNPQWRGVRTKLMNAWPTNEKLWDEYSELYRAALREERPPIAATKFYKKHRRAMDAGAEPTWTARHEPDELSAVQHAMDLKIRLGDAAVAAEYQNEPLEEKTNAEILSLTAEQLIARVNRHPRREVPQPATRLTTFIDVQKKLLYYVVVGWSEDFTGWVLDYGTFPKQNRIFFTGNDARETLQLAAPPKSHLEAAIFHGLQTLTDDMLGTEWLRPDKSAARIERCLIDANWGDATNVVYQFCRQSKHAAVLLPSHGRGIGASSKPLNEYNNKPGDRVGLHWRIPIATAREVRHVVFDTNFWKTFAHTRLTTALGDRGALTLFGTKPESHRFFASHLAMEFGVPTEGRGRKLHEWKLRPGETENHWWDGIIGNAVAASIAGIVLPGTQAFVAPPRRRRHVSYLNV